MLMSSSQYLVNFITFIIVTLIFNTNYLIWTANDKNVFIQCISFVK